MSNRRAIADQSERLEPVVTYSRLSPDGELPRGRHPADGELRLVPDREAGPVDDFAAYEPPLIDGVRVAAVPPPLSGGRASGTLGAAPVDGMAIRPRKGGRALTIAIAIGVLAVIGGVGVLATTFGAVTETAKVEAPSVVPVLPAATAGPATAGATADAAATPAGDPIRQVPLSGQAAPAADATAVASAEAAAGTPPTPVAPPPLPQMRADHLAALAAAAAMPMTAAAAPVSAPPANDVASLPPAPAQPPPPPVGGMQSSFGMQASTAPAAQPGDDQSFVDRISRTLADRNGNAVPAAAAPMQPLAAPMQPMPAAAMPPSVPMSGAPVVVNGEGRVYDGANVVPLGAPVAMESDGPVPPEPVGPHARTRWWPPMPPLPIPFFAASAGN
jgi:hypothetical protein